MVYCFHMLLSLYLTALFHFFLGEEKKKRGTNPKLKLVIWESKFGFHLFADRMSLSWGRFAEWRGLQRWVVGLRHCCLFSLNFSVVLLQSHTNVTPSAWCLISTFLPWLLSLVVFTWWRWVMAQPPSAALTNTLMLGAGVADLLLGLLLLHHCFMMEQLVGQAPEKLEQVRCDPAVIPHCLPGAGGFWWVFLLSSPWHVCHRCPAGTQESHALQSPGTDVEMLLVLCERDGLVRARVVAVCSSLSCSPVFDGIPTPRHPFLPPCHKPSSWFKTNIFFFYFKPSHEVFFFNYKTGFSPEPGFYFSPTAGHVGQTDWHLPGSGLGAKHSLTSTSISIEQ